MEDPGVFKTTRFSVITYGKFMRFNFFFILCRINVVKMFIYFFYTYKSGEQWRTGPGGEGKISARTTAPKWPVAVFTFDQ